MSAHTVSVRGAGAGNGRRDVAWAATAAVRAGRHRSWHLSLELPAGPDGSRRRIRRVRRGGYPSRKALTWLQMPASRDAGAPARSATAHSASASATSRNPCGSRHDLAADTRTARREPGSHGGHSGMRHGGHRWMMIACRVPMLIIAIALCSLGVISEPPGRVRLGRAAGGAGAQRVSGRVGRGGHRAEAGVAGEVATGGQVKGRRWVV